MSHEESIKTRLDAHSGLSALVSSRTYTRIPQDPTYPLVVYQRVDTNVLSDMAGGGYKENPRFQFDVVGASRSAVRGVVEQLVDAMVNASTYKAVFLSSWDLPYEEDEGLYRTAADFSVW